MPNAGQRMTRTLDGKGFVRIIAAAGDQPGGWRQAPGRDRTNNAPVTINSAVAFQSIGGRAADADAVHGLAERREAWAPRQGSARYTPFSLEGRSENRVTQRAPRRHSDMMHVASCDSRANQGPDAVALIILGECVNGC